jgi:hypothetical protein
MFTGTLSLVLGVLTQTCSVQLRLRGKAHRSAPSFLTIEAWTGKLTQQVAELDGLLLQRRRRRETCGCGHNLGVVVCVRALTKGNGCFVAKRMGVRGEV